jgi:hypothetical protein
MSSRPGDKIYLKFVYQYMWLLTISECLIEGTTWAGLTVNMKKNAICLYYPLANEVAKGYSNATVLSSVTSLWTL